MRILLFLFITSLLQTASSICNAQSIGLPTDYCAIHYTYDNAGNRIKRYYKCVENGPFEPSTPATIPNGGFRTDLFPNPTSGTLTGILTEPSAEKIVVIVTTMLGGIVLQQEFLPPITSFTINIAQLTPGSYLVSTYMGIFVQSDIIIKM
jgi:hypothetical protein